MYSVCSEELSNRCVGSRRFCHTGMFLRLEAVCVALSVIVIVFKSQWLSITRHHASTPFHRQRILQCRDAKISLVSNCTSNIWNNMNARVGKRKQRLVLRNTIESEWV